MVLVLDYKNVIFTFYGFICDFLENPSIGKIFQNFYSTSHRAELQTRKIRVYKSNYFLFSQICMTKVGVIDHPWKDELRLNKIFATILPNFAKAHQGNERKFNVSFALYAHVDIIKYRKHRRLPSSPRRFIVLSSSERVGW